MLKKCTECTKRYEKVDDLYLHIETEHAEVLPKDWSPSRYIYSKKYGRPSGKCMICGNETKWNDTTNKPYKLCIKPQCREVAKNNAKNNMIKRYGKEHLLNDPNFQIKMMAGRSISGEYAWSDGVKKQYVGSYEKDFLQFLDVFMDFESADVHTPAWQIFEYEYNGKTHFYIPDVYLESINAVVEIKDGGDNPNTHHKIQNVDKEKERAKDEVMAKQTKYNYIKVVNKQYGPFLEFLIKLRNNESDSDNEEDFKPVIMVNEQVDLLLENIEMVKKDLYICIYMSKYSTVPHVAFSFDGEVGGLLTFTLDTKTNKVELTKVDKEDITDVHIIKLIDNTYVDRFETAVGLLRCLNVESGETNIDSLLGNLHLFELYNSMTGGEHRILAYTNEDGLDIETLTNSDQFISIYKGPIKEYSFDKYLQNKVYAEIVGNVNMSESVSLLLETQFLENKLTNSDRKELDDSDFGLPSEKKYPMPDKDHVIKAIQFFKFCPNDKRKELASNIKDKADKFGIEIESDLVKQYLKEQVEALLVTNPEELQDNILTEDTFKNDNYKPVFIFMTYTGTAMSKMIRAYTHQPYSHVSISFDPELKTLYSFGRKEFDSPMTFTVEDITAGIFKELKDGQYALYSMLVENNIYENLQQKMVEFSKRENLKFNYIGFLGVVLNKPIKRDDAYFCSEFVASVMKECGIDIFNKDVSLMKPYDFAKLKELTFVSKGDIKSYKPDVTRKKVLSIKKFYTLKEAAARLDDFNIDNSNPSPENAEVDTLQESGINRAVEFRCAGCGTVRKLTSAATPCPTCKSKVSNLSEVSINTTPSSVKVSLDPDGSIIIKKQENVNFMEAYSMSHQLLTMYEETGNIDGMKYELAKLWYLIILIENRIMYPGKIKKLTITNAKRQEAIKARAFIMNDFKKYMKFVIDKEKGFNFQKYFGETQFGVESYKIDRTVIQGIKSLVTGVI